MLGALLLAHSFAASGALEAVGEPSLHHLFASPLMTVQLDGFEQINKELADSINAEYDRTAAAMPGTAAPPSPPHGPPVSRSRTKEYGLQMAGGRRQA